VVVLGPSAAARVDTLGLDRNAWTALIGSAARRVSIDAAAGDWHTAGFDRGRYEDLSRFRGAAAGRNIVLVSLESTAAQYLGMYGADVDMMPNLSELSRSGIVFENAYAVYPESIKGLFSILCSTYPAFDTAPEMYARVMCPSVAAVLSQGGYRTALFHSGRFDYLGMNAVVRGRGYGVLADAGDIGGHHDSSFGVDEQSTVSRILSWVDALPGGQRFFLTYLPIAGHHPYETLEPGPFRERTEFDRYRNAIHEGDAALGTLMRGLRTRGLDRRTLWIVLGDHGEAFGQHDGNYGHTFFLYDENVRVPFVIAAPGMTQSIRSRQVVSLIDTAPTVLDLLGLDAPETYQGRSMLDPAPRLALFFADYSLGLLGVRDGPLKFIYEVGSGRSKLFDMDVDSQEKTDQSNRYPVQARWYQENLQRWSASQEHRLGAETALR
jgi:phosphoglycerol transferase MdoB-like AlkP superfamily enzyme